MQTGTELVLQFKDKPFVKKVKMREVSRDVAEQLARVALDKIVGCAGRPVRVGDILVTSSVFSMPWRIWRGEEESTYEHSGRLKITSLSNAVELVDIVVEHGGVETMLTAIMPLNDKAKVEADMEENSRTHFMKFIWRKYWHVRHPACGMEYIPDIEECCA